MNGDEGHLGSRAQRMEGAGSDLLARAAFTGDEHRCLAGGHLADRLEDPLHDRGAADHPVRHAGTDHLALEFDVLGAELALPQSAAHEHLEPVDVHRLGHKIVGTAFHGLHRRVHRTVGRHHDADRRVGALQEGVHELHPVVGAELQVGDDDLGGVGLKEGKRTGGIARHRNLKVFLESRSETLAGVFLIVDNQDIGLHHEVPLWHIHQEFSNPFSNQSY